MFSSNVQAFVLDPVVAVSVGMLEAEMVVEADLFGENIFCNGDRQF